MKLFRPKYPAFLKLLYPGRISRVQNNRAIYLTFDDGPVPEATPWVLDQLKEYNAKSTFFCIGENVKKHPDIFQKVLAEGHTVGNHTYNHLNGWKTSVSGYIDNIKLAEEVMMSKVNSLNSERKTSNYPLFRPPYGKIKNSQATQIKRAGYKIVLWDVISGDYDKDFSAEECYQHVIKNAKAGTIIVLHDSIKASKNLRIILPKILEYYTEKGFEFRSLTDVL